MFKSFFGKNKQVRFSCPEEYWDVVPKPYPAKKFMPDWLKALPMRINNEEKLNNSTIKRCVPFLDAMSIGYIIPLAADVYVKSNEDASGIEWNSAIEIILQHKKEQITTDKVPNPNAHMPPLKFISHWVIQTPPGWSTLFIPPINREDTRFSIIGGLVDTDNYFNQIYLPFFFKEKNYEGILKTGTPLAQAIPIKRSEFLSKANVEKFTEADYKNMDVTKRRIRSHESYYRNEIVEKK